MSDETKAEIERLRADSAETHAKIDSLAELARASRDTSNLRAEAAERARARAEQHRRDADAARQAVARAVNLTDSMALMQVAYEERTLEAESEKHRADTLQAALALALRSADLFAEQAITAQQRLAAVEALNERILADVAEEQKGCRILGLVRCPTRKEAFISGLVIGGTAGALVR